VFGLRPAELQGLGLLMDDVLPVAKVQQVKRSSRGSSGARSVPAVPPPAWSADCHGLVERWKVHGLPPGMVTARSQGEVLSQQLNRLEANRRFQSNSPKSSHPTACATLSHCAWRSTWASTFGNQRS
jgi:hypothetical protein